jgi:hypothetical protein
MNEKLKSLLRSRRFYVAVAGVVAVVATDVFNIELDTEQLVTIGSIIAAWIIGDTVRETK